MPVRRRGKQGWAGRSSSRRETQGRHLSFKHVRHPRAPRAPSPGFNQYYTSFVTFTQGRRLGPSQFTTYITNVGEYWELARGTRDISQVIPGLLGSLARW